MNFADNWARVFVVITFLTFGEAQIIGGIVPNLIAFGLFLGAIGYFLGLFLAQLFLLLLVTQSTQSVIDKFGLNGRNLFAGIWIGIGLAFSWVAVIP